MSRMQKRMEYKRRKEMYEKILNKPLEGESYIDVPSKEWKRIVIQHFNQVQRKELSIEGLLRILKEKGITFNQKDHLVIYPIKNCLRYIAKVTNKDISL